MSAALVREYIEACGPDGCALEEVAEMLDLTRPLARKLVRGLETSGRLVRMGRALRWRALEAARDGAFRTTEGLDGRRLEKRPRAAPKPTRQCEPEPWGGQTCGTCRWRSGRRCSLWGTGGAGRGDRPAIRAERLACRLWDPVVGEKVPREPARGRSAIAFAV